MLYLELSRSTSRISHLFVASGLGDRGGLDDGLVTTFDENPVASGHSVHLNLVSKKAESSDLTPAGDSFLTLHTGAKSLQAHLATEIQRRPTVQTWESSSSSRV